jgi:Peroxidase
MNNRTNGVLILAAAGIFLTTADAQEVQTISSCFERGQDIVVTFRNGQNPRGTDWVGIYPADNVDPLSDPLLWHWTCGDIDCEDPMSQGAVLFSESDTWMGGWPPSVGTYRAVLAEDAPLEYVFMAITEEFRIVTDLQQCGNTDILEVPQPTISAAPLTPTLVTRAPVASPSLQAGGTLRPATSAAPTTTPSASTGRMGQIIESAKNDIIALIQERPERRALYLRMIFHDCVGGACDGCINAENMDNGGLGGSMGSLLNVTRKYEADLSRADIWALASFVGVEQAMPGIDDEGDRIELPFRYYGREDCNDRLDRGPDPPLCSPNLGTEEVLDFFEQEFNFTPSETAAIMGGHTM